MKLSLLFKHSVCLSLIMPLTCRRDKKRQKKNRNRSRRRLKRTFQFPTVNKVAVTEYDKNIRIWSLAFPWLFPGGMGGFDNGSCIHKKIDAWMENLVYYEDGRFAKDFAFCFYVNNFQVRKKNQKNGSFFVKSFYDNGPKSLTDLQEALKKGETAWLDKITYFSTKVHGSTAYWRQRRNEVYTWIRHHVEKGNGTPTFFITLSCAEYHWPDIKRLIRDRCKVGGVQCNLKEDRSNQKEINDWSIVVQEYFQMRVLKWLETVGRDVFRIKHHWLRFEFAPSRGQIHAHMLVISDYNAILSQAHKHIGHVSKQADFLAQWVKNSFNMTCDRPKGVTANNKKDSPHPSKQYMSEVTDMKVDQNKIFDEFQCHKCNGYCLRKRKKS